MTEIRDPIAANRGAHCLPLGAALDATETASSPVQGGDGVRNISRERRVASADQSLNPVRGPFSRGAGAAPSIAFQPDRRTHDPSLAPKLMRDCSVSPVPPASDEIADG